MKRSFNEAVIVEVNEFGLKKNWLPGSKGLAKLGLPVRLL